MLTLKEIIDTNGYEESNEKVPNTEYVWARRGQYYDYIERSTGKIYTLPAVTLAYDTQCGMFGKNENDIVALYNENGTADDLRLRQMVREAGGYLALDNFTLHIKHFIDINGYIVNIDCL